MNCGTVTIYPDFTIRHPKTGKAYYGEHFGLMDNKGYAKNAFSKMILYHAQGIDPSDNLIITYESRENPLSLEKVDRIIEEKFL